MHIQASKLASNYITLFRELVNDAIQSSDRSVLEILRFNKQEDWSFVTIAMDVFGDANQAIENFLKYGTSGPTKLDDLGEKYLRLYGLLSATYNQQESVRELHARMNVTEPKKLKKTIDGLIIRTLRHKLASHSTNYLDESGNKGAFAPTQAELSDYSISTYSYSNGEYLNFDLIQEIKSHYNCIFEALDNIIEKSIKTVFKANKQQQAIFFEKLVDLRFERSGGIIITPPNDGEKIKIKLHFASHGI